MTAFSVGFGTSMAAISYPPTSGHGDGYQRQLYSRNMTGARFSRQTNVPLEMEQMDVAIDSEIHRLEKEAYAAVMRALSAQSDSISIDKLPLISELRKELRVSDHEQREILSGIDSDDVIREIRQKRKHDSVQQSLLSKAKKTSASLPPSHEYSLDQQMRTPMVTNSLLPVYHLHAQQLALKAVRTHGNEQLGATPEIRKVTMPVPSNNLLLSTNGERSLIHTKNPLPNPCADRETNKSYELHVPSTEKIIQKIERICKTQNPKPAVVKNAKLLLKNCEEVLVEAIEKIETITDQDEIPDQQYHEAPKRRMHPILSYQVD